MNIEEFASNLSQDVKDELVKCADAKQSLEVLKKYNIDVDPKQIEALFSNELSDDDLDKVVGGFFFDGLMDNYFQALKTKAGGSIDGFTGIWSLILGNKDKM